MRRGVCAVARALALESTHSQSVSYFTVPPRTTLTHRAHTDTHTARSHERRCTVSLNFDTFTFTNMTSHLVRYRSNASGRIAHGAVRPFRRATGPFYLSELWGSYLSGHVLNTIHSTRVGQYTEKIRILCIIRIILYSVLIRFVLLADIIQRTVHVHTAPRRAGQRAKANHKRSHAEPRDHPNHRDRDDGCSS